VSTTIRKSWSFAGAAAVALAFSTCCHADALSAINDLMITPTGTGTGTGTQTSSGSAGPGSPACNAVKAMEAYYQWSSSNQGSPAAAQALQTSSTSTPSASTSTSMPTSTAASTSTSTSAGDVAVSAYKALENTVTQGGTSVCAYTDTTGQQKQVDANQCAQIIGDIQGQLYAPNPCVQAIGIARAAASEQQPSGFSKTSAALSNPAINPFAAPGFPVTAPVVSGNANDTNVNPGAVTPPAGVGTPSVNNPGSTGFGVPQTVGAPVL
jgi:hypothetical protein